MLEFLDDYSNINSIILSYLYTNANFLNDKK